MVLSSLSSRFNKLAGSFLLRRGLSARYALGRGVIRDNPTLDVMLLTPLAQKLLSLEVKEDAFRAMKQPSTLDIYVNATFDTLFGDDDHDSKQQQQQQHKRYNYLGKEKEDAPTTTTTTVRLQALEKLLRPILIPNEQWSDVRRWQFNLRFLKWARSELLVAKYGASLYEALDVYPQLYDGPYTSSPQLRSTVKRTIVQLLTGGTMSSRLSNKKHNHHNHTNTNTTSTTTTTAPPEHRMVLPSASTILKAFDMKQWTRRKNVDADWKPMEDICQDFLGGQVIDVPGSSIRFADVPPDTDLSLLSLEDVLEVAGGHVHARGPFNVLCEEHDIYEFWTKDYMAALASYLLERSQTFHQGDKKKKKGGGETIILEVGAGDGVLSHFVRTFLEMEATQQIVQKQGVRKVRTHGKKHQLLSSARDPNSSTTMGTTTIPRVIATDDGSWNITPKAPVEQISVKEALAKYAGDNNQNQVIVLCSWMPMGDDWTSDIRAAKGVEEYILIGECDDGNCGDNWRTWGNLDFFPEYDDPDVAHTVLRKDAPYVVDGFKRTNLNKLSKLQFSRFDSALSSNSKTVSFRRK